jgi:hypothetical protein
VDDEIDATASKRSERVENEKDEIQPSVLSTVLGLFYRVRCSKNKIASGCWASTRDATIRPRQLWSSFVFSVT